MIYFRFFYLQFELSDLQLGRSKLLINLYLYWIRVNEKHMRFHWLNLPTFGGAIWRVSSITGYEETRASKNYHKIEIKLVTKAHYAGLLLPLRSSSWCSSPPGTASCPPTAPSCSTSRATAASPPSPTRRTRGQSSTPASQSTVSKNISNTELDFAYLIAREQ